MTVLQIQSLLLYYKESIPGCDPGTPDGIIGAKTSAATRAFQHRVGITEDGQPGAETQAALVKYITAPLPAISDSAVEQSKTDSSTTNAHDTFWNRIKHFKREEFRCPCGECGGFPVEMQEKLVTILDTKIWEHFGTAITVVPLPPADGHSGGSGVRCAKYNATLSGSVPNSRHLQGKAADIIVRGFSGSMVEAYCQSLVRDGYLRYCYQIGSSSSVHIDIL